MCCTSRGPSRHESLLSRVRDTRARRRPRAQLSVPARPSNEEKVSLRLIRRATETGGEQGGAVGGGRARRRAQRVARVAELAGGGRPSPAAGRAQVRRPHERALARANGCLSRDTHIDTPQREAEPDESEAAKRTQATVVSRARARRHVPKRARAMFGTLRSPGAPAARIRAHRRTDRGLEIRAAARAL